MVQGNVKASLRRCAKSSVEGVKAVAQKGYLPITNGWFRKTLSLMRRFFVKEELLRCYPKSRLIAHLQCANALDDLYLGNGRGEPKVGEAYSTHLYHHQAYCRGQLHDRHSRQEGGVGCSGLAASGCAS
jgi:hypothetical protein